MTENSKLEDMGGSDKLSSNCQAGELGENGGRKVTVSDHVNGLQHSSTKSDSFVVDMERFSHLIERDINSNSRITRNLSRKGSGRNGERKISSNEKDATKAAISPRATFHGGSSTPEKPAVVAMGAQDHSTTPQLHHHQITITSGGGATNSAAAAEGKSLGRSRRSPPTWAMDPRRILFFFATLSCMGTVLLIYFTLSMGKLTGDENIPN